MNKPVENISPKVAVIVVNWNRRDDTLDCLSSISEITYHQFRVILVDNASKDGSSDAVRSKFPEVKLIQADKNLRFAGGNNLGLRDVLDHGDEFCLLLNNDTTVEPDFLDKLIETAQSDQRIGLVGPKILYHSRPDVIWFAGGVLKPAWGYVRHFGLRQQDRGDFDLRRGVSFLTGCCLLIRRKLIEEIGLLDEDFYLYSEDADYCLRAVKAGYKLIYEPKARIYHKVSQSTGGSYHPTKWKHRYRSLCRFVRKHGTPLTWPLFCLNLIWEFISLPVNALLQTRRLPPPTSANR
ncbi:MAG: glycosyltransferase family 2 protein [bacterium]